MGYERIKTEHAGAKNGGGAWMTRAAAKRTAKHKRRQADKRSAAAERMRGLFAHIAPGVSLADELIADRRPKSAPKNRQSLSGYAARANNIDASVDMPKDPWTDPDPQPGDFDSELDSACYSQIEARRQPQCEADSRSPAELYRVSILDTARQRSEMRLFLRWRLLRTHPRRHRVVQSAS
jgi:hypothetical protein